MTNKSAYYTLTRVDNQNAHYNLIVGERSNGKTTAALLKIITRYTRDEGNGVYLRQMDLDLVGHRGESIFGSLVHGGKNKDINLIEQASFGKYQAVKYYRRSWFLGTRVTKDDGEIDIKWEPKPFCYAMSLSGMKHDKSATPANVTTVVFDEFMPFDGHYLTDETVLFRNTISTIVRESARAKIYLIANTTTWNSPYFTMFGAHKHVMEMKPGEIRVIEHTKARKNDNVTMLVAIEYCKATSDTHGGKDSDVYFVMADESSAMITDGKFAVPDYPKCPHHFTKDNVKLVAWVKTHTGDMIRVRLMKIERDMFLFADGVTNEQFERLKDLRKDIFYSLEFSGDMGHYIRLSTTYPGDERTRIFANHLGMGKIFFESNTIGENLMYYVDVADTRSIRNLKG